MKLAIRAIKTLLAFAPIMNHIIFQSMVSGLVFSPGAAAPRHVGEGVGSVHVLIQTHYPQAGAKDCVGPSNETQTCGMAE